LRIFSKEIFKNKITLENKEVRKNKQTKEIKNNKQWKTKIGIYVTGKVVPMLN
jgi:hypothetical protein